MQRQILEFLRMCKVSEAILNGDTDQNEMTFQIDGEEIVLVRLTPATFLFEIELLTLPVAYSEKNNLLMRLLDKVALATYLSNTILCANTEGDKVLLQKLLRPELKNGSDVMKVLIELLKTYDWWYNTLDLRGKGGGGKAEKPSEPLIFG